MAHHDAFEALQAEAAKQDLPKRFPTDLTKHDRNALHGYTGAFAWGLYESGTQLIKAGHRDGVGHDSRDLIRCVAETLEGMGLRWYFWDGVALLPCRDWRECAGHLNRAEKRAA